MCHPLHILEREMEKFKLTVGQGIELVKKCKAMIQHCTLAHRQPVNTYCALALRQLAKQDGNVFTMLYNELSSAYRYMLPCL